MDSTSFECPRCRAAVQERFYGPCGSCREELRVTMSREPAGGDGDAGRFEPKMNVVPNQVATKE